MLKKAHKSLIHHETNKIKVDMSISCNILDDVSILSSSTMHDNILAMPNAIPCNNSLIINENVMLKEKVEMLTHDLARCYVGESKIRQVLDSQRFSINKEGLRYVPKKGKKAFVHHKTMFVKGNSYCMRCKKTGHVEKECKNVKDNSYASFDSCYVLRRCSNGSVKARFIGTSIIGTKKNTIWVPKALVTNIQGPKQIWVPKRN